eukprot:2712212-Rhodomonas_salina.1
MAVQDPHHHWVEGQGEEGSCRWGPLLEPSLSPDDDVLQRVDRGVSQGSSPPIVGLDDLEGQEGVHALRAGDPVLQSDLAVIIEARLHSCDGVEHGSPGHCVESILGVEGDHDGGTGEVQRGGHGIVDVGGQHGADGVEGLGCPILHPNPELCHLLVEAQEEVCQTLRDRGHHETPHQLPDAVAHQDGLEAPAWLGQPYELAPDGIFVCEGHGGKDTRDHALPDPTCPGGDVARDCQPNTVSSEGSTHKTDCLGTMPTKEIARRPTRSSTVTGRRGRTTRLRSS